MLLYSVVLGESCPSRDPLAIIGELIPEDVGAITKFSTPHEVRFGIAEAVVIVTAQGSRIFIDAPYRQEAVGVAWSVLVALTLQEPESIWLNPQTYDVSALESVGVSYSRLRVRGVDGLVLLPSEFERLMSA